MKRREFIVGLGGAAMWPVAARAQQPAAPVVGFLSGSTPEAMRVELQAFDRGLADAGYMVGEHLRIEYRWASHYDQLPALAGDLVAHHVAVIVAMGNVAAKAAKTTTDVIPIVFHTGDDPIATGLVARLNETNGNMTGVSAMAGVLPAKRLELLHQLTPSENEIGVLINPANANVDNDIANLQSAARSIGLQVRIFKASNVADFDSVFAALIERRIGALLVNSDLFLTTHRDKLVALSARFRVPAIYSFREFADAGGLISYGANRADTYRLVGNYVARILKGEKPSDLPVQQAAKFELVINLKTAKALGLGIPQTLLATADEVIE